MLMRCWGMMARRFARDERGNFALLGALVMIPALGAGALAIDGANAFRQASGMQSALDAAAIAAAVAHGAGKGAAEMSSVANHAFWANYAAPSAGAPILDEADEGQDDAEEVVAITLLPGVYEDQVQAEIRLDYRPVFWHRIAFPIDRRSVAARVPDLEACILALSRSAARAFEVSGSASADMSGCTITANSQHGEAIYVGGSSSLVAECLYAVGGIVIDPLKVELACEAYREGTAAMADPFRNKALPRPSPFTSLSGCGQNFVGGGGGGGDCNGTGRTPSGKTDGYVVQLKPGTYRDLEIKGSVALAPGNYIVDGGKLKLASQSVLSGKEITFFLINGAELEIAGGATFDITPASGGDWAGFVIVAEHGNTSEAIINGNSRSSLTGIIYMPDAAEIRYSGNSQTTGECIRIVAQEITLIGNALFAMDCDPQLANVSMHNPGSIRLVE